MTARIGVGCLRISDGSVSEEVALETLVTALTHGATLVDTADVYAPDERSIGHGERLVARALSTAVGRVATASPIGPERARVRDSITVVTKGGLVRRDGRWSPDGRAKHLTAACEASLRALDVACVDVYLLHAPDPRTPIETSARALAALQRAGLARAVGLCNVGVNELEAAARVAEIAFVQVRLGPAHDTAILGGVVAWCASHGVQVLAHTPLGGAKGARVLANHPGLVAVAQRHPGATPLDVALASVIDLDVIPIAGPTRPETARRLGGVLALAEALDNHDRADIESVRPRRARPAEDRATRPPSQDDGEIVVVMGLPASGKTTIAKEREQEGYVRLNRDERGGSLERLAEDLDAALRERPNSTSFVLDNTYLTRASRSRVIGVARAHGRAIRCVWVRVSIEQAQVQACARMIGIHGALPSPEQIAAAQKKSVGTFGPSALFRARRAFEPVGLDEGFDRVVSTEWSGGVGRASWAGDATGAALVLEASALGDGDAGLARARVIGPALAAMAADGAVILGTAWRAAPERLVELSRALGVDVAWSVCPHAPGPPVCWCRKPLPGLGVEMVLARALCPWRVVHVGRGPADRGFAARCGFRFVDADAFFAAPHEHAP